MDVYDSMVDMCTWCNIEREESYLGGGLYMYKCPKCDSRVDIIPLDVSYRDQIKVYIIQLVCWSLIWI